MRALMFAEPVTLQADKAQSLDQLWNEASQLGAVRIAQYRTGGEINACIAFERKSGTKVEAVGKNTNVAFALADAINEARDMGAGE